MHLPLHLEISEQLRQHILDGKFLPGEQLPSEHQLMLEFAVSRITARRAIANLIQQGLVTSYQGKGVFVKEQQKVMYSLSSPMILFEEDMARQGFSSSIQNLVFESILAPEDIRTRLQLRQGSKVYLQKKLLLLDGVPVAVDVTYLLHRFGKTCADELQQRMTFPTLEQNQVPVDRIEATLECTHANHEISEYLNVPLGNPLLVYCYTAYTRNGKPILCGEALSRGDRLCYSVTITKDRIK
ncbi:MAG: GntR family transcriptional regulator [Elainellaceae cyanobacterium]